MTNIEKDNKIPLSMLKISFLNELPFKGSYKGMRYILKKILKDGGEKAYGLKNIDDKDCILKVYTYKDLYNFENSEDINEAEFSYDKDGINKALEYLDEKVKDYN